MNITVNIEQKISESDAAVTATNTITNAESKRTPSDNKEMARLKHRLDYNKMKSKSENPNTSVTNTTEIVNFGAKMKTSRNERKSTSRVIDEVVETGRMKKNQNHDSDATKSVVSISKTCENIVTRAKKTKDSKGDTRITNEDKDKPTIETEAMKRIRLSLELKNKSKLNKKNKTATSSTSSLTSATRTCQNVEEPVNTKNPGKGIKRKVTDVGTDKTHVDNEGMKKIKLNNPRQNENYPNISEITNEQMDIDYENGPGYRKNRANAATGTGSKKNATQGTESTTEKVVVETEAMKMIRRRLEIKKNKNNNENTATSTITSATINTGTPTGASKDKEQLKSPKHVKRKTTTVDNPTEEMKRMNALKHQREKSPTSTTSNATLRKTNMTIKIKHGHKYHKSVAKYNITPEITDDECNENLVHEITDENPAVPKINELNSEITNNDKNASRSSSRCRSAMSVDEDDIPMTDTERVTRSKNWERRVWK